MEKIFGLGILDLKIAREQGQAIDGEGEARAGVVQGETPEEAGLGGVQGKGNFGAQGGGIRRQAQVDGLQRAMR